MCCILCLESPDPPTMNISIFSDEGAGLQIESIIAKHFWLQPDADVPNKRTICPSCWQALYAFHKFYLSIEHAQNLIELQPLLLDPLVAEHNDLKPELHDIKVKEEMEALPPPAVVCELEQFLAAATERPRRRRGRPRKDEAQVSATSAAKQRPTRRCAASTPPKKLKTNEQFEVSLEDEQEIDLSKIKDELDAERLAYIEERDVDFKSPPQSAQEEESEDSEPESAKITSRRFQPNAQKSIVMQKSDAFISESNFRLICALCPYGGSPQMSDFTALMTHYREQHQTRGYVLCCGKKLFKRGLLCDHLHVHQDPTYFSCPQCEKVLADRRCLENHLKSTHDAAVQKRERSHQCSECGKGFHTRALLKNHSLTHWPDEQKTVPCPQCEKTFATEHVMKSHLRLVHLRIYAKICDTCGRSINGGNEALRRHQAAEHPDVATGIIAAGPLRCELCGFLTNTKHGLARHMKVMHTKEHRTPQVCSICSKVSPSLSAHQSHVKYTHRLERKHTCPMCPKAFKRPGQLKEHLTTHTGGAALYTCPHCPKTFNSNANMHSHRKKQHRQEWEESRRQRYDNQQKNESP